MPEDQIVVELPESSAMAPKRYSFGLMAFHWISALVVIVLIGTGWWMLELIRDPARMKSAFPIFQFHKSLGMLVFAITLARIALRLRRKAPGLPVGMANWERLAALIAQALFYLLLVAIPLTGWLYISTEWAESLDKEFKASTLFFGQFAVPYANFISEAEAGVRRTLSFHLSGIHAWLAYGLLALIVLHVAASMKHHFLNRDDVLSHMLPGLRHRDGPDSEPTLPLLGLARLKIWLIACLVLAALGTLGWMKNSPPSPPAARAEVGQTGTR